MHKNKVIIMDKKEIRKEIIKARKNMSQDEWQEKSGQILSKLTGLSCYKRAKRILVYCSYNNEADTNGIIKESLNLGKEVYVPKVIADDNNDIKYGVMFFYRINDTAQLTEGYMGIPEPDVTVCKKIVHHDEKSDSHSDKQLNDTEELIICPLVAFDEYCNRIGYGGGFYDRYLAKHNLMSVGIAFELQKINEVQSCINDVALDVIVTDGNIYYK